MLRCVISTITNIKTSYKCSYLAIIPICLCVHNNAFLMMREDGSNNLYKSIKVNNIQQVDHLKTKIHIL